MQAIAKISTVPTMTSLELVKIINEMREDGQAELRHTDFTAKVRKVLGEEGAKFSAPLKTESGQTAQGYIFPKREAHLMVMSESYKVQAAVYDKMTELEEGTKSSIKNETINMMLVADNLEANIKIDKLLCSSRYDGFFEAAIVDIVIDSSGFLKWRDDEAVLDGKSKREDDNRTIREIVAEECLLKPHNRIFITDKEIEVCKDGSTANAWDESSCYPNGSYHDSYPCSLITWNTNYDEMPVCDELFFIKWIEDGRTDIRFVNKSWFDTYRKGSVEFVAFSNVIGG